MVYITETYAFGFDELAPLALNGTNTRYGWGLTMVDSLDTAIIMDLQDEVKEMLQFISQVDFTTPGTDEAVQLFGTVAPNPSCPSRTDLVQR